MIKILFLITVVCFKSVSSFPNQGVPSLKSLVVKTIADLQKDKELNELLKLQIKDDALKFVELIAVNGLRIEKVKGFDLSDLDISGGNFSKYIFEETNFSNANLRNTTLKGTVFNKVNLKGADLRGIFTNINKFEGCTFNNSDLEGALLYGEKPEKYVYAKNRHDACLYIKLMQSESLGEEQEVLKNFLSCVSSVLKNQDLSGLDLTDLDLSKEHLEGAYLGGTRFSKNVVLPDYGYYNTNSLFRLWFNGNKEERELMEFLFNHGVNLVKGVPNLLLRAFDWKNKDFENAYLAFADLTGCDFTGIDLKNAKFNNVNLSRVRFSKNVMLPDYKDEDRTPLFDLWVNGNKEERELMEFLFNRGINLVRGVDNARLRAVDWKNKDFENADLSKANLTGCDFTDVDLKNTKFNNVDLSKVRFSKNVMLPDYKDEDRTPLFDLWFNGNKEERGVMDFLFNHGVNLVRGVDNARLRAVDWKNKDFENADLSRANLSKTDLSKTNLTEANLSIANLSEANLSEANLSGANLSATNLLGTNLSGANLSGANLLGTNLLGTNLSGANLSKTRLSGTNLTETNLSGANLSRTDLSRANLSKTNLSEARLEGADLSGAKLSGAKLSGADLSRANLSRANLFGANLSEAKLEGADLTDVQGYQKSSILF